MLQPYLGALRLCHLCRRLERRPEPGWRCTVADGLPVYACPACLARGGAARLFRQGLVRLARSVALSGR